MNETVFFETVNGAKVFCHFSTPQTGNKKLVIMCNGFRGSSIGPARQFVDFQKILNTAGYAVLRFDQPNSGNSEGDYLASSFNEWVDTIVYFSQKYLEQGYVVSLLGQSMGATAVVVASNNPRLKGKIPCLLLWVPDAKTTIEVDPKELYEEAGQKYKGSFWQEARDSNFFHCLEQYTGSIHLIYGETDKYVRKELVDKTIQIVKDKGQPVMILKGQDHSSWDYEVTQNVYKEELLTLTKNIQK